jgi:hypothetical protein
MEDNSQGDVREMNESGEMSPRSVDAFSCFSWHSLNPARTSLLLIVHVVFGDEKSFWLKSE